MNISSDNPAAQESVPEFSVIEENAIYYAAGFVIRKLLKKCMPMIKQWLLLVLY